MRLYPEYDDIGTTGICEITDDARSCLEIAFRAENSQPVLLHRPQVGTARVQRHIQTGARHRGSKVATYGAGSGDQESHGLTPLQTPWQRRRAVSCRLRYVESLW